MHGLRGLTCLTLDCGRSEEETFRDGTLRVLEDDRELSVVGKPQGGRLILRPRHPREWQTRSDSIAPSRAGWICPTARLSPSVNFIGAVGLSSALGDITHLRDGNHAAALSRTVADEADRTGGRQ